MTPPCVVDFDLLSTEWSKNLFTIIIMDYKTADEKLPRNYALTIKFLSHKHASISLTSLYLKAGERTNLQKGAKNKRTTISNDTLIVFNC